MQATTASVGVAISYLTQHCCYYSPSAAEKRAMVFADAAAMSKFAHKISPFAKEMVCRVNYLSAASTRAKVSREGGENRTLEGSASVANEGKSRELGEDTETAASVGNANKKVAEAAGGGNERDGGLVWRRLGVAKDAEEVLRMIREEAPEREGEISGWECSLLISAAVEEDNMDLAFSVLDAIRRSSIVPIPTLQKQNQDKFPDACNNLCLKWPQPDVSVYATFIRGLAASLRVSDAVNIVERMCCRGVPVGKEVAFGKVISCPTCKKSLAVVQPQHGIQLVPCSQCRYNYELMSGDVISYNSESISNDWSIIERWLRQLPLVDQPLPMAVHSFVVQDPDGLARTLRFATESVSVPAQEGERVTFVSAAPSTAEERVGPFSLSRRTPGWRSSEPMSITNHMTSTTTPLLRPPPTAGSGASFDRAFIIPAFLTIAGGDAATAFIDPSLPRLVATYLAASIALGGVFNVFIYPRLNLLPQRTADAVALRQKLLAQYEVLQQRIQKLSQAAISQVRMMARMFQLQNKMQAVGEPAYSARIVRVRKAQEGIYQQLLTQLELIDKYAKVASMIEIEVEMDVDVLAVEAVNESERLMEQVENLMEAEDLQKKWTIQEEASDEVERLLNSIPLYPSSS